MSVEEIIYNYIVEESQENSRCIASKSVILSIRIRKSLNRE